MPTGCSFTADAGGSNGYRVRAWKVELTKLAAETGLTITPHDCNPDPPEALNP